MISSIPDKTYKLLVLLGVIILGYCFYFLNENEKNYIEKITKYNDVILQSKLIDNEIMRAKEGLLKFSNDVSVKYDLDSLITIDKDKKLTFTYTLKGDEKSLKATELISSKWENYENKIYESNILNLKIIDHKENLNIEKNLYENKNGAIAILSFIGILFLFSGLIVWVIDENRQTIKDHLSKKINERYYISCQSCGKAFSAHRKYGTEKDGSLSNCFCKECYQDGEYTNVQLTKEEYLIKAEEDIKNLSSSKRKKLMKRFKELDRWNPDRY